MTDKQLWTFKYEPSSFDEMILNDEIRPILKKAIVEIPNLLLHGSAGVGKGTFTKIFLKETGLDYKWVNASDKTGIDFIRNEVSDFAWAAAGGRLKVVVFNEACGLTRGPQGAQKILKQLMEDTAKKTRYIYLANEFQNIIPELKSRCEVISVGNPPIKDITLFCAKILRSENVKFENKVLIDIVKKHYPDIRKTIWTLQSNSIDGELKDLGISNTDDVFKDIMTSMKSKDIENVRKILRSTYINYPQLYEYVYENCGELASPGGAILSVGDHARWDLQVGNKEINFMHMVVEMIWKKIL